MSNVFEVAVKLFKLAKHDSHVKIFTISGVCVLALASYYMKKIKIELYKMRKKRYPKNVAMLHRLNKGLNVPHDRPTLMKLETWLRMTKIEYEVQLA